MTGSAPPAAAVASDPYVGPRPFRRGELFFGREREAVGLTNALISGRVVLLHSPSGAGKTSLIQAAIAPTMARRGFQICAQQEPFSAARVTTPAPDEVRAANRYVAGVVTCLLRHLPELTRDEGWTISQALDRLARDADAGGQQQLLLLDQFEEILTADPTDFDGQRGFFHQLGEALDVQHRWALIAMREDFMGGLDRFLRYIPGQLRSTYRLDLLDADAAMRAIQVPAREFGVDFAEAAATKLIADLQLVRAGSTSRSEVRSGTYVEPVFLQVVCDSLWRKLTGDGNSVLSQITVGDVSNFGPLDAALRVYYDLVVREAARGSKPVEREIRDWIQTKLLTRDGMRSQTRSEPDVRNPERALNVLQERYLIRSDPRSNTTWWELSHDRLSEPILEDNRAWRDTHLERWQRAAYDWHRAHHDSRYLLKGDALKAARASRRKALTPLEREFLDRSEEDVTTKGLLKRANARFRNLRTALIFSVAFNAALLVLVFVVILNR
jgi:hypothetical protein